MKNEITVIITVRDRDTPRLENQLKSIRDNGADPSLVIVDYGSEPKYAKALEAIALQYNCEYLHVFSEGRPWNKCHAINIAAKISITPYIVTSDMDNIFISNPFSYCLNNYHENSFYSIEEFWMKKRGDSHNASPAGHGNYGMYLFTDKKAYYKTGGYDERIVYWGMEDLDWPERLKKIGYTQEWLPEEHKIYHQWHPTNSSSIYRPDRASQNTMSYCLDNAFNPVSENSWGENMKRDDRPILSLLFGNKEPYIMTFEPNAFMQYFPSISLVSSRNKGFVKLLLGPRYIQRPFNLLRKSIQTILRPITALSGSTIVDKLNVNYDYFYSFLPLLIKNGLRDWYISPDVGSIYLLWD